MKNQVIAFSSIFCALVLLASAGGVPSRVRAPAGVEDGECFTVLVGKNSSANGSVVVAHNEDGEAKAATGKLINTWVFALEKAAEANCGPMRETLEKELLPVEKAFIAARPKFEKDFAALYAKDKTKALKKLDAYVVAAFEKVAGLLSKILSGKSGS